MVSISAALDDLASYDYQNAKSYVLDAGSYRFYLSENSHSWASIDPSDSGKCYEYTQQSTITYNSDGSKRASDEIVAVNQFDDITNYHFVAYTDNRAGNGYAHNMTRADFAASFPTAPTDADLVADEKVLAGINYIEIITKWLMTRRATALCFPPPGPIMAWCWPTCGAWTTTTPCGTTCWTS